MASPDPQRLSTFIEPHLTALNRTAYRLCRNAQDAEDLVQEVCLRALQNQRELQELERPRARLLRVQYHLFVDQRRRRGDRREQRFDDAADGALDQSAGPEADTECALLVEALNAAWPGLSADQQALLALHAEGHSLAELVEITGLPTSALKARLHRARRRLGKLIKAPQQRPRIAAASGGSL